MNKLISYIGFLLLIVGCAAMDSESIVIPAMMVISGAMVLLVESRREEME